MTDDSGHAENPGDRILSDSWTAGSHLAHAAGDAVHGAVHDAVHGAAHGWDGSAGEAHSTWANLDY